ncbi:MAG TPA: DUF1501 domain-containing protein, partial [Acidimicrobiales bacterium]|nr:DUF1501 domain-containing protein [Acidimicrobiales bacterium]
MAFTRREFVKGGVAAFTWGFAAPAFLSDVAQAQGAQSRNLVVLYLGGGNDSLNTVIPYNDGFYYSRRPTIAVPGSMVLQIGSDAAGNALGLHPRLTGLSTIFSQGRMAIVQRTGYPNLSRSHFLGTDIWSTASMSAPQGPGWLGRYLDTLPSPVDPLIGWNTNRELPRTMIARTVSVPSIPSPSAYAFSSPNTGAEAGYGRTSATRISSHVPVDRPHLAFVNGSAQGAFATMDRVATVATYTPTATYPNTGLGNALRAVAGAIVRGIGTKVFWVQTGGYDTHASQGAGSQTTGAYYNLMATINDAILAFYVDMQNQGLLGQTTLLEFSEFGRRVAENGSGGVDHGRANALFVLGSGLAGGGRTIAEWPGLGADALDQGDLRATVDYRSILAELA